MAALAAFMVRFIICNAFFLISSWQHIARFNLMDLLMVLLPAVATLAAPCSIWQNGSASGDTGSWFLKTCLCPSAKKRKK